MNMYYFGKDKSQYINEIQEQIIINKQKKN